MRGSVVIEAILALTLVAVFWVGLRKEEGFTDLSRTLSERLESLQKMRERYDGRHS